MKSLSRILSAAGLVLGLAACRQLPRRRPEPAAAAKPASPAAIAAAKEILAMKNASAMYANAVPNIVQQTKDQLMQTNLNYQKDLNEVAVIVAQKLAGRENEIGDGMAKVYASRVHRAGTEGSGDVLQVAAGPEAAVDRAQGHSDEHGLHEPVGAGFCRSVNGEFRAEMRKRGKQI